MKRMLMAGVAGALLVALAAAGPYAEPLPVETIPANVELPARYPGSWMFVHDFRFSSILDGRVAVVDLAAPNANLKGSVRAAQLASFLQARSRPELYTAETFFSRLTRGERTDAITVLDAASLAPIAEIILPDARRGQSVTQPAGFQFTDGDRLALVFNFTPASSVTVVDLVGRKVLNEVEIPGCSLVYPTGRRGFFTLCSNGGATAVELDEGGKVIASRDLAPFNDIDDDAMFMMATTIGGTTYFPTFKGNVRPVDVTGATPRVLKPWPLVTEAERRAGWRPSGWQVIASDALGRLYVLMQSGGKEGSHKDGGKEVWVYDAAARKRVARIALEEHSVSIEVTRGAKPLLAAAAASGQLGVYDVSSGQLTRTLGGGLAESPLVLHAAR